MSRYVGHVVVAPLTFLAVRPHISGGETAWESAGVFATSRPVRFVTVYCRHAVSATDLIDVLKESLNINRQRRGPKTNAHCA